MGIKLEKPQPICGFSSFVSTRDPVNCDDATVLTQCPHQKFSLSCPLAQRCGLTQGRDLLSGSKPHDAFRHVTWRGVRRWTIRRALLFNCNRFGGSAAASFTSMPTADSRGLPSRRDWLALTIPYPKSNHVTSNARYSRRAFQSWSATVDFTTSFMNAVNIHDEAVTAICH